MKRPKSPSSDIRYLASSAFNSRITFQDPDAGQAADGTPLAPTVVKSGVAANVSPWRSKEVDKTQTRVGISSYKVVIRTPKTWTLDGGMQLLITRAGTTHTLNIDSFYDPDMQGVETHIYAFETDAVLVGVTQ